MFIWCHGASDCTYTGSFDPAVWDEHQATHEAPVEVEETPQPRPATKKPRATK